MVHVMPSVVVVWWHYCNVVEVHTSVVAVHSAH